jgi:hypothetical protein
MTVLRVVVGLTIWIDAVATLVLLIPQSGVAPGWLDIPMMFVVLSHYIWMSLRWSLALTLLIREARASRLRTGSSAPLVRLALTIPGHAVLGVLSLIGWLSLLINTLVGERVLGYVLHVALPTFVVVWLARSARRQKPEGAVLT